MSKTRASCFVTGSKHRETDESTQPGASCFHLFLGVCGLVLSSVSRCLEPVMKHEARVFDILLELYFKLFRKFSCAIIC